MIMAEMGLGYGSEYQLMRFLGHHRDDLDKMIQNAIGQTGEIKIPFQLLLNEKRAGVSR